MKQVILTRREFYDLVWSEPLTSLTKKYDISDGGLRKLCRSHNVPLPRMGHWQKIKAGKRTRTEDLPASGNDDKIMLEILEPGDVRQKIKKGKERVKKTKRVLGEKPKVPDRSKSLDPLVLAAKNSLLDSSRGVHKGLAYTSINQLDITVSKNSIERAVTFMNVLIKIFRESGYRIEFGHRESLVVVYGQPILFRLREKQTMEKIMDERGWSRTEYTPTGKLYFKVGPSYQSKEFSDGALLIEDQLAKILVYIEELGKKEYQEEIDRKIREEIRLEKERLQREFEKKQATELKRFIDLLSQVDRWQKLKLMRAFIEDTQDENIRRNTMTDEVKDWIEWARKKADWYDPIINAKDELLDGIDKETLKQPTKSWY